MSAEGKSTEARHFTLTGTVQGVGFRPFVFRLAQAFELAGWVLNGEAGVEIHAEGTVEALNAFQEAVLAEPPPAARIERCTVLRVSCLGGTGFTIQASRRESAPTVRISPDLATCEDCRAELRDPTNPRYAYPYINCTHCGPRYSIVRRLPYDRPNTTMADWSLCEDCAREYHDPRERRFHAQPIACARCGPHYFLVRAETSLHAGPLPLGGDPIAQAAQLLRKGAIVAVKGIGGYHLACDGRNAATVELLRSRKYRKEKPFALLVRDLTEARQLVRLTAAHDALLASSARPIVVAEAQVELPGIAPDNSTLGVMLPYAPLQELLFQFGAPSPLVLTSANRSQEPIAYRDDDARERLDGIADAFLIGERPIARRVDDSVVTVRDGEPFMIRRSRGYAPGKVARLVTQDPVLALGGDLKSAVALAVAGEVFVSQFLGDLDDLETQQAFQETVQDLLAMYQVHVEQATVVHDLHPQFYSTRFAERLAVRRRVAVQHHHAHVASVLAEHDLWEEAVIGLAWDGTGFGTDGSIWGGEFLVGSLRSGFQRAASLPSVMMPGGDAAARYPVQAAAGFLSELADLPDLTLPPFGFSRRYLDALALRRKNVRCFRTSSMGRLFDTVAALCGFTREVSFEGQAAIWLESQARRAGPQDAYEMPRLDHQTLLRQVVTDRRAGRSPGEVAAAFHAGLAHAAVEQTVTLARQHGIHTVALSGGTFQNELLFAAVNAGCREAGLQVRTNRIVPVNDGGLCLGQAALAGLSTT